jgi:hypothetical protein
MPDWKTMLRDQRTHAHWEIPGEPEIEQSLEKIRRSRAKWRKFGLLFGTTFVLMMLVGAYMTVAHLWHPEAAERAWALLFNWFFSPVFILSLIPLLWSTLRNAGLTCPCCGKPFHARVLGRWGGLPFSYRNNLSGSCLNCGLRLNGTNISEAKMKAAELMQEETTVNE